MLTEPNDLGNELKKPPQEIVVGGILNEINPAFKIEQTTHQVREELDRMVADADKENLKNLSPEEVLRRVAKYSEPYMGAPLDAFESGTFAGIGKLHIVDGKVLLLRHASDELHLTKGGQTATPEQLRVFSEFHGGDGSGAGAVPTTANIENTAGFSHYGVYGIFKIPVHEFLALAKMGKLIIGNPGEEEIIMSGDVAAAYLSEIYQKDKKGMF